MKTKITLLILAFFCILQLNAQVKIGDNPTVIDSSAILELSTASKGLLIPRLTQLQRNLITSPATGLLIFQTDNSPGFYYYNGINWTVISNGITNETDPVFNASVASGITLSSISNWNNAFAWGNHAGLYRPISWVPAWTDVTGKPSFFDGTWLNLTGKPIFATIATSGSYNDLSNKPALFSGSYTDLVNKPAAWDSSWTSIKNKPTFFDGAFSSLTGKPTTLEGYGITNAMSTAHAANGITTTNISNWNTAYSWGNHAGLYRPIAWVPAWTDVTGKPSFATIAVISNFNFTNFSQY